MLTGIFGIDRLQLAEDVVQEALMRAFQTWPYYGVPANPAAWLTQTAKNLALDLVRREKRFYEKQPEIITFLEQKPVEGEEAPLLDTEVRDGRLRLMFACCHPLIPVEAQAALALKTLCGFGVEEIARAFLTTDAAIAKRLTRARQKIRELHIPFEIPVAEELATRLDGVRQTLYLLFNEGYKASSGDQLVREDLCTEAIRMVTLLAEHPAGNEPATHALAALMLFNGARLAARVDADGNMLRLNEQDRSQWNRAQIDRGVLHLRLSATGRTFTAYHLQAGIAACHCHAENEAATDWGRILLLYDHLVRIDPSPVVALNRAVAVGRVHGAQAALDAVEAITNRQQLNAYYLLYSVQGEFAAQLGHFAVAADHLRRALDLTAVKSERDFLLRRLRECEAKGGPASLGPRGGHRRVDGAV